MVLDQTLENHVSSPPQSLPPDDISAADDVGLIVRVRAGERQAFSQLLARHYDFIYRTAYKWSGDQGDAEDVAQDVCVKLATALKQFDGRSAFTSWLYRITLNAVRDMQRARMRQNRRHRDLKDVSANSMPANQEEVATESALWRAVRQLPEKQRDAVLLIYAEELSHAAAAEVMQVKESTISWYVHEARKTLKGLL